MKNSKYKMAEPIQIGRLTVKNRIVLPPMNTNLTSEEGYVTPYMEEYYIRRAKGGAGLIVLEAATVDKNSRNHPVQAVLYDRKHVASWASMVEKLHRYGAKVSVELVHYGSEASIPRVFQNLKRTLVQFLQSPELRRFKSSSHTVQNWQNRRGWIV